MLKMYFICLQYSLETCNGGKYQGCPTELREQPTFKIGTKKKKKHEQIYIIQVTE